MCNCTEDKEMNQEMLMKYGIAAGILFAGYKFGPSIVKAGVIAVAAVAIAKRIPYVNAVA